MPKGTKASKEAKRRVVARGVIAGQTPKQIAAEAQASVRHVERLVSEPETQLIIADMMRPHRRTLEALTVKALDAVDRALDAQRDDGNANHEIQLRAVGRLKTMLELAQGRKEVEAQEPGLVTWEQFVMLYAKRAEVVHAGH